MSDIIISQEGAVRTLTLNRSQKMNALTSAMRMELIAALKLPVDDVRAIVIRGADGVFCAGQDLNDFAAGMGAGDVDGIKILEEEYEPILNLIAQCPRPVIAAVEGACVGAGMSLALACDYVIASNTAYFQLAFAKIALVPDVGVSYFLPRLIGQARAMSMALRAKKISANEALEMGMIAQTAEAKDFDSDLDMIVSTFAIGPSQAYSRIKTMMRASLDNDYKTQLRMEAEFQNEALHSSDFKEGVMAFMQKRPPKFNGS